MDEQPGGENGWRPSQMHRSRDLYGDGGTSSDAYGASDRYGPADPYATSDPHGAPDPYASDPFAGADPYATPDPYGSPDPYASPDPYGSRDPLVSGPEFSSDFSGAAPEGHAQHYGASPVAYPPGGVHGSGGYVGPGIYAPPPQSTKGLVGFILGLLAITMCGGVTAPVGLVFAILGMKETAPDARPPLGGRGLTVAGLVLSIVGMFPLLVMLAYVVLMIGVVATQST